jgi:hypothetical protein
MLADFVFRLTAMPKTLQIRDVPDDLHAAISARAKAAGMTISQYLLRVVSVEAARPTNAEVMELARNFEFRHERRISPAEIVSALHEGRDER